MKTEQFKSEAGAMTGRWVWFSVEEFLAVMLPVEEVVVSLDQLESLRWFDGGYDPDQALLDYFSVDGDGALGRLRAARDVCGLVVGRVLGERVVDEWREGVLYWRDRHPVVDVRLSGLECAMVLRALDEVVVSLGQMWELYECGREVRQAQWEYFSPASPREPTRFVDLRGDEGDGAGELLVRARGVIDAAVRRVVPGRVVDGWLEGMVYWQWRHLGEFGEITVDREFVYPETVITPELVGVGVELSVDECRVVFGMLEELVGSVEQFEVMQAMGQDVRRVAVEYFDATNADLTGDGAGLRLGEARRALFDAADRVFPEDVTEQWCERVLHWNDRHPWPLQEPENPSPNS